MGKKTSYAGQVGSTARKHAVNANLEVNLEALKESTDKAEEVSAAADEAPSVQSLPSVDNKATDTAPVGKRKVQANRVGKVNINFFTDRAVKKQFMALAVEEERNQQTMMHEALNLLFQKYGKPPIA